mgnify:CR=1 FL=1
MELQFEQKQNDTTLTKLQEVMAEGQAKQLHYAHCQRQHQDKLAGLQSQIQHLQHLQLFEPPQLQRRCLICFDVQWSSWLNLSLLVLFSTVSPRQPACRIRLFLPLPCRATSASFSSITSLASGCLVIMLRAMQRPVIPVPMMRWVFICVVLYSPLPLFVRKGINQVKSEK